MLIMMIIAKNKKIGVCSKSLKCLLGVRACSLGEGVGMCAQIDGLHDAL